MIKIDIRYPYLAIDDVISKLSTWEVTTSLEKNVVGSKIKEEIVLSCKMIEEQFKSKGQKLKSAIFYFK